MSTRASEARAVQEFVGEVYGAARTKLDREERMLHEQGYRTYSVIVADFRLAVERAMLEAVNELSEYEKETS